MSRGVKSRWRFRLLQVGVLLVGTALAARVVFIQVLRHDQWLNKANGQWTRTVEVEAERGNLYDRNGRPLALSVSSWRLGIAGSRVDDAPELARRLGEILDRDPAPLLQSIRKAGQDHVVLDRNIVLTRDQKRQLMIEPAVTLEDLRARVYPHDGVGASLIGFYRHDKDEAVATGLELGLADVLAGRSGTAQEIESAVKGRQMGRIVLEEARHGRNVKLTLDIDLQAICERELAASVTECGADGGCVLVLDPDNGDVLASASWPLLSSRDRPQRDERVWINGNFTQQFEPGSVFKIFSTASLLRNGAVDTATVYDCSNGDFVASPSGIPRGTPTATCR